MATQQQDPQRLASENDTPPEASKATRKVEKRQKPTFNTSNEFVNLVANKDDENAKFTMHKDFACHYSPVLEAAFNSNFLEGQSQTYTFSEHSAETVQLLVAWLYTQDIPLLKTDTEKKDIQSFHNYTLILASLWILADKLIVPGLQNASIRKLSDFCEHFHKTPAFCLVYVYENTGNGSPLRRWFLHRCASRIPNGYYIEHASRFPKEMLLEIVDLMVRNQRKAVQAAIPRPSDMSEYEVADHSQT